MKLNKFVVHYHAIENMSITVICILLMQLFYPFGVLKLTLWVLVIYANLFALFAWTKVASLNVDSRETWIWKVKWLVAKYGTANIAYQMQQTLCTQIKEIVQASIITIYLITDICSIGYISRLLRRPFVSVTLRCYI